MVRSASEAVPEPTLPGFEPEVVTPDTNASGDPSDPQVEPSGETLPPSIPEATTPPLNSVEANPDDAVIDFGANKEPQPYDDYLQAALADIQQYWRTTYPQVYGEPYQELQGGIYAAYPDREEPIPGCGEPESTYEEVREGGAFYCDLGDFIAYDDFELVPDFSERLGNSAIAVVFAHEFGHAIQSRAGELQRNVATVFLEQQADCFAGSWAAHVARGESDSLTFGDAEVKSGLIAMVEVKDPVVFGTNIFDPNAHGSAFDRVGAFQEGFINGAARCTELIDDPLQLLNLQFNSDEEILNEGNLPYVQIGALVEEDLTRFWNSTFTTRGLNYVAPTIAVYGTDGPYPECAGVDPSSYRQNAVYCPDSNQVVFDDDFARELHRTFGDFTVGYLIGLAWSDNVQTQLGGSLGGQDRALATDCLIGAWTQDTIPPGSGDPNQALFVSPGDLDEAVSTALIFGDEGQNDDIVGSGFEKIASYRVGVLGGVEACGI